MSEHDPDIDVDAIRWFKSSRSIGAGACVELGRYGALIALRNSRKPATVLLFTRDEISAFLFGARAEEFDHLLDDES